MGMIMTPEEAAKKAKELNESGAKSFAITTTEEGISVFFPQDGVTMNYAWAAIADMAIKHLAKYRAGELKDDPSVRLEEESKIIIPRPVIP